MSRKTLIAMDDNSIEIETLVVGQQNNILIQDLAAGEEAVVEEMKHTVRTLPLISSFSLPNKISTAMVTVSVEGGVPAGTDVLLSDQTFELLGESSLAVNSTLTSISSLSNWTVLGSESSWSAEEIGAVSIVSLMVPFILLSNVVVIFCVIRFRGLHTPTNYFVTSLAAVDIVVALATPFVIVVEVFHFGDATGPRDVVLCLLPNRALMMACGVSVLTLAAIAYDRHTALVSPLEYTTIMTSRKVAVMVTASWIYSLVIVWLPLVVDWYNVPSDVAPCSANLIHGKAPVLFLGAIFVPSCLAILVCYFRIFMVARHHVKAIAAVELSVHRRLRARAIVKDTKYATTLAVIIGAFLALWLPYLLYIFTKTVISMKFDIWMQTYLILLAVFNSGINPWIYAFRNNELRAALRRLYSELCGDTYCRPVVRRACQLSVAKSCHVSVISSTPELSFTDSDVSSGMTDLPVCALCESRANNLDHLDYSSAHPSSGRRLRSHERFDGISSWTPSVFLKKAIQQTTNVGTPREVDRLALSTNIFIDLPSTVDSNVWAAGNPCAVSGTNLHQQAATGKLTCGRHLPLETLSVIASSTHQTAGCTSTNVLTPSLIQQWIPEQPKLSHTRPAYTLSLGRSSWRHHLYDRASQLHQPRVAVQAVVKQKKISPTLPPHTIASSTLPPHTIASSTLSPHTIPSSTLPPHTIASSTLPPNTVTSPTIPPHTVTLPTLPSHTVASPTLPPHTIASPTLSPHTVASPTLPSHTVASPTLPPHTITSPTLSPHTVVSPTLSPHTVTPTLPPHTVASPILPPHIVASTTLHTKTILSSTISLQSISLHTLHPHVTVAHNSTTICNSPPTSTTHSNFNHSTITRPSFTNTAPTHSHTALTAATPKEIMYSLNARTTSSASMQPHDTLPNTQQPHVILQNMPQSPVTLPITPHKPHSHVTSPNTPHPHVTSPNTLHKPHSQVALPNTPQPHVASPNTPQPHVTSSNTPHSHVTSPNKLHSQVALPNTPQPHVTSPKTPHSHVTSPNKPHSHVTSPNTPHSYVTSPNTPHSQITLPNAQLCAPPESAQPQYYHSTTPADPGGDTVHHDQYWRDPNPASELTRCSNVRTPVRLTQYTLSETRSCPFPRPADHLLLHSHSTAISR